MSWYYYNQPYASPAPRTEKFEDLSYVPRLKALLKEDLKPKSRAFAESLLKQAKKNNMLSEAQAAALTRLEAPFDPEVVERKRLAKETWEASITDEMREDFRICVAYYATTGYWTDLVALAKADSSFFPSENAFNKMVGNKYAQRVLTSHKAKPKFAVKEMVMLSSGGCSRTQSIGAGMDMADYRAFVKSRGTQLFVVLASDSAPIVSAVAGAKRYTLLPLGEAFTVTVEERDLKRAPKAKKTL